MKTYLLFIFLLPSLLVAQDDLSKRIETLEALNSQLLTRQKLIDKEFYDHEKKQLEIAMTLGSSLSTRWNDIKNNLSVTMGLAKVTEINSVGNENALGFEFNKVIEELVETSLTAEIENLQESPSIKRELKSRWQENVAKIINNPIIQGLVKSNPLTSVASSLITSAIGFTNNKVETVAAMTLAASNPLPPKYKDFVKSWKENMKIEANSINSVGSTKNLISQTAIENFTKSIRPYTDLFDQMSNSNTRFRLKLEELSVSNASYGTTIGSYDEEFMRHLKITKISDAPGKINELLKVNETENFPSYREAIYNKDIQDALKLAHQYSDLKERVNNLTVNYYQIHIDYFNEYIQHLDTALANTVAKKTKFDQTKILIAKEFLAQQIKKCDEARNDLVKSE